MQSTTTPTSNPPATSHVDDAHATHAKIRKASLLLFVTIFLSRVLGFFREWILAHSLGASSMTDVYYASFTVPDFINYLMAAGALSLSLIPILSDFISKKEEEKGKLLFRALLTYMGALLLCFIFIGEIFSFKLAQLIAPGFSHDKLLLLSSLLKIILPAQFFFYIGGLATAIQNIHGRFLIPALAPIMYNGMIILCGGGLVRLLGVQSFSIGVALGACVSHGVLQYIGIKKLGYSMKPLFYIPVDIWVAVKKYIWLSLPLALGFSVVVSDEWISKYFASQLTTKKLSWLSYARVEMRIPVAILGQAIGVASFPFISSLWSKKLYKDYTDLILRELIRVYALAPLCCIFLYFHAEPITHFLFGGGRFGAVDIVSTAEALQMSSFGVFFWILQIILARAFYAAHITWLPSLVGGIVSVVSLPLYYYLCHVYDFRGLALGGSFAISLYGMVLALLFFHHVYRNAEIGKDTLHHCFRFIVLWSGVLIIVGLLTFYLKDFPIYQHTTLSAFLDIAIHGSGIAGITFFCLRRKLFYFQGPLF